MAELHHVDAMLGHFPCAHKNDWNVPTVSLFENRVVLDVYFMQRGAKFTQQGRDGRLSFFAKMAARSRIERHLARTRDRETRVFRMRRRRMHFRPMLFHGFGLEYFWNGPAYGWNARAR